MHYIRKWQKRYVIFFKGRYCESIYSFQRECVKNLGTLFPSLGFWDYFYSQEDLFWDYFYSQEDLFLPHHRLVCFWDKKIVDLMFELFPICGNSLLPSWKKKKKVWDTLIWYSRAISPKPNLISLTSHQFPTCILINWWIIIIEL